MLAYLDPGSGSMIAQAVVAGVAGAAVVGKVGWKRISGPFRRKSDEPSTDEESGQSEPADR